MVCKRGAWHVQNFCLVVTVVKISSYYGSLKMAKQQKQELLTLTWITRFQQVTQQIVFGPKTLLQFSFILHRSEIYVYILRENCALKNSLGFTF